MCSTFQEVYMDFFSDGAQCVGLVLAPSPTQLKPLMSCRTKGALWEHEDLRRHLFVMHEVVIGSAESIGGLDARLVGLLPSYRADDYEEREVDCINTIRLLREEQGLHLWYSAVRTLIPQKAKATWRVDVSVFDVLCGRAIQGTHPVWQAVMASGAGPSMEMIRKTWMSR